MLLIRPALAVAILLISCAATALAQGPAAPAKNKDSQEAPLPKLSELQNPTEIKEFEPPVEIVTANGFMDGGTTYVVLRDAKKRLMILCVSQSAFEETVPGNTLFLNAAHSEEPTARLPFSKNETRIVVASLESAVKANLTEEEREALQATGDPGEQRIYESVAVPKNDRWSANEWTLTFAFDALRRLQSRVSHDVVSADGATKPAWHAAWAAEMAEKRAEEERECKADELFESFYPEAARACFHSPAVRTAGAKFDEPERIAGQQMAEIVGDPVRLAVITCKALGTLDDWRGQARRTRIAIAAASSIDGDAFASALDSIKDDPSSTLGGAHLFFLEQLGDKIPEALRDAWTLRLGEAVLNSAHDHPKQYVLSRIGALKSTDAVALLWRVAKGETGKNPSSENSARPEPSLRATGHLLLAERGDANIRPALEAALPAATGADKAAYELSLAILGDPRLVKAEHLEAGSYLISGAAFRIIERTPTPEGLELLFTAALESRAADRAVLAAQRITGQTWVKDKRRRESYYAEDAQKWWADNKTEFLAKLAAPTP
jgi:hypothetical protein